MNAAPIRPPLAPTSQCRRCLKLFPTDPKHPRAYVCRPCGEKTAKAARKRWNETYRHNRATLASFQQQINELRAELEAIRREKE